MTSNRVHEQNGPHPELEETDELSGAFEEEEWLPLAEKRLLAAKDQAEVDRFCDRAFAYMGQGLSLRDAWVAANRDEDIDAPMPSPPCDYRKATPEAERARMGVATLPEKTTGVDAPPPIHAAMLRRDSGKAREPEYAPPAEPRSGVMPGPGRSSGSRKEWGGE